MDLRELLHDPDPLKYQTRILDIARCPLCRAPLVARMGRQGPCFPCLCPQFREVTYVYRQTCATAKTCHRAAGHRRAIGKRRLLCIAQRKMPKGIHSKTRA